MYSNELYHGFYTICKLLFAIDGEEPLTQGGSWLCVLGDGIIWLTEVTVGEYMVEKAEREAHPGRWLSERMEELRGDESVAREVGFLRREMPRRSEEERDIWSRLGVMVLATLAEGSAEKVRGLERSLREESPGLEERIPEDPEEMPDEVLRRLEMENVLRVLGHYREIEERSISARELREKLGVSREQMSRLRSQGRLLGILLPFRQSYYYPAWQFDPESGETFEGLPELMEVAEGEVGMDALSLDAFMTSRKGGELPHERFGEGRDGREWVLNILRAARDVGS